MRGKTQKGAEMSFSLSGQGRSLWGGDVKDEREKVKSRAG